YPDAEGLPYEDPSDAREVTTLLRMLTYLEFYLEIDLNLHILPLEIMNRIFGNMFGDPANFEFLEELARLTLLLTCAGGGNLKLKKHNSYYDPVQHMPYHNPGHDIDLLLETFPNAPRIGYRHLLPAVDFFDWSSVLIDVMGTPFPRQEIMELCISHGADVNIVHEVGDYATALIAASAHGRLGMVKELLRKGALVNMVAKSGNYATALIAACENNQEDIVKELLQKDACVNIVAESGNYATALIAASAHDHPSPRTGLYASALIPACAYGHLGVIKELLRKGVRVNESPRTGLYVSALFAAADSGNVRSVRLLLKHGANEVPRAALGGWRRGVREDDGDGTTKHGVFLLVELMILELVRGNPDNRKNNSRCGEDALSGSAPDADIASGNYPAETHVDRDDNSELEAQDEGGTAEAILSITTELCRRMVLDPQGTSEQLIRAFSFSRYKDGQAVRMGFKNLVDKTGRRDWRSTRAAWCEFLDLAEKAEDEGDFSLFDFFLIDFLLIDGPAGADIMPVRRVSTDFEMGPYSDADDFDEDEDEDEEDEKDEDEEDDQEDED
ncbi:ankyrin repeat domain-containing protein, partial [Candidatus Bathyarchaeota archaeon]|nr:ankyrin repeat domain-containing protein [Candidatus Bathyarchaeota archaeon]